MAVMANRWLRDAILDSERVNALSYPGEVFYRRLMSAVDDFGRYDARLTVLRSRLYGLRVDLVSERDIEQWLDECCRVGLVTVYFHNSKPYLVLHNLGEPRAVRSKYPEPPADANTCAQVRADANGCKHMNASAPPYALRLTPSASRNTPLPPEGGKDESPTRRKRKAKDLTDPPGFGRFWEAYPRHTDRQKAIRAWNKLEPDDQTLEAILAALEWQRRSEQWMRSDGQFIPHATTYLNGRRWEDEPPVNASPDRGFQAPVFLPNAPPMFGPEPEGT